MIEKLVIGTANFGMEYGIANKKKLSINEAFKILDFAHTQGIWGVDTAKAYGDAETLLGEFFKKNGKVFRVITKLSQKEYLNEKDVEKEIVDSLNNLGIPSIDFVLIHSFETYAKYKKIIIPVFQRLCREGIIGKYGVSVYHPEEVEAIINEIKEGITVEFPVNLFDQRFLLGDFLKKIKDNGNFLFARSVFLQGLFFLNYNSLTGNLSKAKDNIDKINNISREFSLSPECIALLFVIEREYIDGVILGIDSKHQLMCNINCLSSDNFEKYRLFNYTLQELKVDNEDIILPYRWNV